MEGFCNGLHKSPHKGFSVEFKEHRQYVHGDEIRTIDWKLFGKTDRLYIREYEEETNLRCNILLDKSGSMGYCGSRAGGVSKHDYAVRLAACLGHLMLAQQDAVGLIHFDDAVRRIIPPRSKPTHLTAIVNELSGLKAERETELSSVFHQLVPKIPRRGLLVIISDLFGNIEELMKALAHFRHAKHEIVIFQIWDPDELDFPFKQWTKFQSLEQKSHRRLIDPAHLRKVYLKNLATFREALTAGCHRNRIDLVPVVTDRPYAEALASYLATRRRLR
ncbi:DUF58 domain-containing protein [Rosistilla oblonga]|uniref:DUF58 domain-containing protein n=1 Tax=Rosistilla oblonga TaxID=2527990 RepID=UPI003A981CCB